MVLLLAVLLYSCIHERILTMGGKDVGWMREEGGRGGEEGEKGREVRLVII